MNELMNETFIIWVLERHELVATICWIQLQIQIHFQYPTTNITERYELNQSMLNCNFQSCCRGTMLHLMQRLGPAIEHFNSYNYKRDNGLPGPVVWSTSRNRITGVEYFPRAN